MPLASRPQGGGAPGHRQRVVQLLNSHEEEAKEEPPKVEEEEEPRIDQSDLWLVKYDELALKTRAIPLSHLSCCKEGAELFSRLCMWVDINQQYVDLGLFPQWDDMARELNIDEMKTEWVRVCVRPEQSFTRAVLEIYMQDGGTLGEVIAVLRKQKQYRIIQEISELAEEFLDVYNTYHKASILSSESGLPSSGHLYSILRTLAETFTKSGQEDPLNKLQLYSGGFKHYLRGLHNTPPLPRDREVVVNAVSINQSGKGGHSSVSSEDSGYTSPHRYAGNLPSMTETEAPIAEITSVRKKVVVLEDEDEIIKPKYTIRILLVFGRDGAEAAELIVAGMADYTCEDFPHIKVDFLRLNEVELWHSLLLNPEGCLMKWLEEVDIVMPILTPVYLQELHDNSIPAGPPAPTSAMINKYIYTLLRSDYVARGCQNTKVRPAIPSQYIDQLYRCKPVQVEPLFKMWKEADVATTKARVTAIVRMWVKKQQIPV